MSAVADYAGIEIPLPRFGGSKYSKKPPAYLPHLIRRLELTVEQQDEYGLEDIVETFPAPLGLLDNASRERLNGYLFESLRQFLVSVFDTSGYRCDSMLSVSGRSIALFGGLTHGDPIDGVDAARMLNDLGVTRQPFNLAPPLRLHAKLTPVQVIEKSEDLGRRNLRDIDRANGVTSDGDCGHVWGEKHGCDTPHTVINRPSEKVIGALVDAGVPLVLDYDDQGEIYSTYNDWTDENCGGAS